MDTKENPIGCLGVLRVLGVERPSLFSQPADDLLARPVVIVVEVQDDRVQRQPLVAAFGAAAADVLEAVEQAIEARANGSGLFRQRVRAFVGGAERARPAL